MTPAIQEFNISSSNIINFLKNSNLNHIPLMEEYITSDAMDLMRELVAQQQIYPKPLTGKV